MIGLSKAIEQPPEVNIPLAELFFLLINFLGYFLLYRKVYSTDEGITGTSTRKRDGFNRMIADCENGKINLILTKEVSRFARNADGFTLQGH